MLLRLDYIHLQHHFRLGPLEKVFWSFPSLYLFCNTMVCHPKNMTEFITFATQLTVVAGLTPEWYDKILIMNEKVAQVLSLCQSVLNTNKTMLIITWCATVIIKILKNVMLHLQLTSLRFEWDMSIQIRELLYFHKQIFYAVIRDEVWNAINHLFFQLILVRNAINHFFYQLLHCPKLKYSLCTSDKNQHA